MIGRLHGVLAYKQPPVLLIDVRGVGYELEASLSTCAQLPEIGQEVTLFTHVIVREDAQQLYGFASLRERSLFRNLLKVNGIGAKLALLILSGMSVESFSRCVQEGDIGALTRLPGIGKKTAERLVVEMRDRVGQLSLGPGRIAQGAEVSLDDMASPVDDAVSALVALGYKPVEATRMIRTVATPGLSSEQLIRQALQSAVRG